MPARSFPALFVLLWATGFIGARYAMPYVEPFTFLIRTVRDRGGDPVRPAASQRRRLARPEDGEPRGGRRLPHPRRLSVSGLLGHPPWHAGGHVRPRRRPPAADHRVDRPPGPRRDASGSPLGRPARRLRRGRHRARAEARAFGRWRQRGDRLRLLSSPSSASASARSGRSASSAPSTCAQPR